MTNEILNMEQLDMVAGGNVTPDYKVELIPGGQPYPPTPKPVIPDQPIAIKNFKATF